jgi:hypothetical protein
MRVGIHYANFTLRRRPRGAGPAPGGHGRAAEGATNRRSSSAKNAVDRRVKSSAVSGSARRR